jgi:sulfite reductase beta subunit-like hemoprotein
MSKDIQIENLDRLANRYTLGFERGKGSQQFLRPKIPSGKLSLQQFRGLAEMAEELGRGYAEITNRQDIQLHWINGEEAVKVFLNLERIGFTTDRCGQSYPGARYGDVRNIVGCAASGIDKDELIDAYPVIRKLTDCFTGNEEYLDLPRKFKMSVSGCSINCTYPEVHDLSFVAVRHSDNRIGFTVFAGGGIGLAPRLADPLDIFVEENDILSIAKSFIELYRDQGPRDNKPRARFKWLIQDLGVEKVRSIIEKKSGIHLERYKTPILKAGFEHIGVNPQKQLGYSYITVPIIGGILSSSLMNRLADLVEKYGQPEVRLTTSQNLMIVGVANNDINNALNDLKNLGFDVSGFPLMWTTTACAGNFCGKAPDDVKARMSNIMNSLKSRSIDGLRDFKITFSASGCPRGCARHHVADIGLQAVELKKGNVVYPGYNLYLNGGLGENISLGILVKRGIDAKEIEYVVRRIIENYLSSKKNGESFKDFYRKRSIEEIELLVSKREMGV